MPSCKNWKFAMMKSKCPIKRVHSLFKLKCELIFNERLGLSNLDCSRVQPEAARCILIGNVHSFRWLSPI